MEDSSHRGKLMATLGFSFAHARLTKVSQNRGRGVARGSKRRGLLPETIDFVVWALGVRWTQKSKERRKTRRHRRATLSFISYCRFNQQSVCPGVVTLVYLWNTLSRREMLSGERVLPATASRAPATPRPLRRSSNTNWRRSRAWVVAAAGWWCRRYVCRSQV